MEKEPKRRKIKAKQIAGAAAAVAIGLSSSPANTEAKTPPKPKPPAENPWLRKTSSLPGYEKVLKPEAREKLSASTVKVAFRHKGYNGYDPGVWVANCTGVKVNANGGSYVSTAAHCLQNITAKDNGLFNKPADQPKAYDFAKIADSARIEYGIFKSDNAQNLTRPIGIVDGISVSMRGHDAALFSIRPTEEGAGVFEAMPAANFATKQEQALPRPKLGQKVALFGVPEAIGSRPLSGTGRYLGRIQISVRSDTHDQIDTALVDIVGIKPKSIKEDACNFSASGSSFSATVKGNATYFSGPLSRRVNSIYDPYIMDQRDRTAMRGDVRNEIDDAEMTRQIWQSKLRVDGDPFETFCAYEPNLPNTYDHLVNGFGVYAPDDQFGGFGMGGNPSMK